MVCEEFCLWAAASVDHQKTLGEAHGPGLLGQEAAQVPWLRPGEDAHLRIDDVDFLLQVFPSNSQDIRVGKYAVETAEELKIMRREDDTKFLT